MRNTMLSLLSLVMIGCAPHAAQVVTPTYTAQKPVIERPSASPTVESARTKQAAADNSAAVTAAKVKQLSANLTDTEEKLSDSVTEVSRLEKQGSATKNELALLYDQLVAREHEVSAMVVANKVTESDLDVERGLRAEVTADLVKAQALITDKDAECKEAVTKFEHAEAVASANKKIADDNATETRRAQLAESVAVTTQKITSGHLTKALWGVGWSLF